MEELIEKLITRLENTAFCISEFTVDTDGNWHKNEKLSLKDTERIIKILEQYAEIKLRVAEFYEKTKKEKPVETPIELEMYLKLLEAHERCLANQVLDITGRNNNG